ncbi:DUF4124 domain-containing protein [Lysobacter hankyongensis]|uniref:DUF4124 domain-containing protein n=1 Tax=Lysobacter hankyongensis TaxID=1176535 RepID=A0ABP9B4S8_9GAMM
MRPVAALCCLLIATALGGPRAAHAGDDVVIYRCTDGKGRLTLRDSPCAKGDRQETRSMVRPKDAPPRAPSPRPSQSVVAAASPPQVIVINAPRPLYECVTPDNARYFSESAEGNPRQVPAWALGAPLFARVPTGEPGRIDFQVENGRVSGNYSSGSLGSVVVPTAAAYGATTWIRDACFPLPPGEVCARVRDRRDEIRRRFVIAQPSERAALSREERSIEARLNQDCR